MGFLLQLFLMSFILSQLFIFVEVAFSKEAYDVRNLAFFNFLKVFPPPSIPILFSFSL